MTITHHFRADALHHQHAAGYSVGSAKELCADATSGYIPATLEMSQL
jgi:hypothetical protein